MMRVGARRHVIYDALGVIRWKEHMVRILLAEDDRVMRDHLTRALERAGYEVDAVESGLDAVGLLEQADYDLLLTDIVMPGMDGPTMVRAIRLREPTLPVLFMSGYAEEQLRESINIEDVSFLPKPFSVQQLIEAVGRIVATNAEEK